MSRAVRGLPVAAAMAALCACATQRPPSIPPASVDLAAGPAAEQSIAASSAATVQELLSGIETAYRQGRYDEGLSLVKRTLELGRRDISVVDRVGSIYHLLGRYGEAIAVWEQGLRLESNPGRRAELERSISLARRSLGLPAPESAAQPAPVEPKPAPAGPSSPRNAKRVAALYEQGVAHYARGEYLQATGLFMRVLELDPEHALARSALARLRLKPGQVPSER